MRAQTVAAGSRPASRALRGLRLLDASQEDA